eukprot:2242411-Amphidinium_carterae.1
MEAILAWLGMARIGKALRVVRIFRVLRLLRLAKLRQLVGIVQARGTFQHRAQGDERHDSIALSGHRCTISCLEFTTRKHDV